MKTKFNLDRDKLNSDYIHSKQDYKKVLEGFQTLKPPIWKNPWFYGPVGLATLAVILVITFQSQVNAYGNNATLKKESKTALSLPEDTPCIQTPISNQDIDYQVFDIFPESGGTIKLKSGSAISIPANSLQSENGHPVQIKIREFHDKASAFIAGIPMDYGNHSAFESAGMIEIRAEFDGNAVALKKGKSMDVQLALHQSPQGFQFWKLNEDKKEWIETPCVLKTTSPASPKAKLLEVESKIEQTKEKIQICENKIADLPISKEIPVKIKSMLPTENARKLVIDFEQNDFPELAGYKDIEFEYIVPYSRSEANLKEYAKRVNYAQSQVWNDMNIIKQGDHYVATFINTKEKYSLPIRPVLKGKSLEEMQGKMNSAAAVKTDVLKKLNEEIKAYEIEQVALEREQDRLKAELITEIKRGASETMDQRAQEARDRALTNRSIIQQGTADFRTNSFGVFNCDKPIPYPPNFPFMLVFETKEGYRVNMENAFVFDRKKNTRYSFGSFYLHKNDQLGWFDHESTLVILDEAGNVYYRKNVNDQPKTSNKVMVQQLDKKALTLHDIQKIIRETPVAV